MYVYVYVYVCVCVYVYVYVCVCVYVYVCDIATQMYTSTHIKRPKPYFFYLPCVFVCPSLLFHLCLPRSYLTKGKYVVCVFLLFHYVLLPPAPFPSYLPQGKLLRAVLHYFPGALSSE